MLAHPAYGASADEYEFTTSILETSKSGASDDSPSAALKALEIKVMVTEVPAHGNGQHVPKGTAHGLTCASRTGILKLGLVTEVAGPRLTATATASTELVSE